MSRQAGSGKRAQQAIAAAPNPKAARAVNQVDFIRRVAGNPKVMRGGDRIGVAECAPSWDAAFHCLDHRRGFNGTLMWFQTAGKVDALEICRRRRGAGPRPRHFPEAGT